MSEYNECKARLDMLNRQEPKIDDKVLKETIEEYAKVVCQRNTPGIDLLPQLMLVAELKKIGEHLSYLTIDVKDKWCME